MKLLDSPIKIAMLRALVFSSFSLLSVAEEAGSLSPAPVTNFTPVRPGEHPRLFFREAERPALRKRAQSPEGQVILARCKKYLGIEGNPEVAYTLWHGAGAGFLFQMTGDKKYADLAREHVQKALDGAIDKDKRYSFRRPSEPLRAGPSISAIAMAYDLCYEGWEPAFRKTVCEALMNYDEPTGKGGPRVGLERMAVTPYNPNPVSNHFALQVGGAGLTVLAIKGDDGADDAKLAKYQEGVDKAARKVLTMDFGQTGYFHEHAGPGVIATSWTFIPWLQAQRVCAGRDWISASSAAEWISLRFVMETLPTELGPQYTNPTGGKLVAGGGYGTQQLIQNGGHHAAYFCEGFGAIRPERKPAMRWVYDHFVQPAEAKLYPNDVEARGASFDIFNYPHRALFALVNWPWDMPPENPEKTMPKAVGDPVMGQYLFRNRWQDADDTIVAVLFGARTTDGDARRCMVWGQGEQLVFGNIAPSVENASVKYSRAKIDLFEPRIDGSGVVSAGGNAIGVDFSKASGAEAVVVMVGPGASGGKSGSRSKVSSVTAGGTSFSILTISGGAHPEPKADGDQITLGGQSISFDGKKIVFTKTTALLK
jgi:hypothetical protein